MDICASTRRFGFWALDSEFMMSGRANAPEDVHSIQFSVGSIENTVVLESADALASWLRNHARSLHVAYAFVGLPDLASIEEWLGSKHVQYRFRGSQLIGRVKYRGANFTIYDSRPLLQNFGLRTLADCGRVVGYPKLPKPEWLGLRKWQTEGEHKEFLEYARADAVITSRIVKWLFELCGADAQVHASAGTLARDWFTLPKRLRRVKRSVVLPSLERAVKNSCYAGRSEGFTVGYTPSVVYNDVTSLYPCSLVATRSLTIDGAVECQPTELELSNDLNEVHYGWIDGVFEVPNSRWDGLPLRGSNNFYATGIISGFYHTFDLLASHVKVLNVAHAYKPIFSKKRVETHEKYRDMLLKRLEGKQPLNEKMLSKAVLNSLTGKLGQSHPLACTSNFFAYSTVLAHSHYVMSKLFDICPFPVIAMDTDSIFSKTNMKGKRFDLSDGDVSFPLLVGVKGKGDLAFFRSKNYILKPHDGSELLVGRHGWFYFYEDFLKLFDGVTELRTRMDIKHTLLTRQREAKKLAKGRWRTKVVTLDLAKLKDLVKADSKRKRSTYDSLQLVIERRNVDSDAWAYEELMSMKNENPLNFPSLGVVSSG